MKIKNYVDENLNHDLSLTYISEQVYLTPSYLSKIFKAKTGENLSEYIFAQKMKKACEMLSETNLSIAEISEQTGFSVPHYFIKKFKETYGITPKTYRVTSVKK